MRSLRKTIPTLAAAGALALTALPSSAATPMTSVRLFVTSHQGTVTTHRWGDEPAWTDLNLGLFVKARGGAFEVQVRRKRTDLPITATVAIGGQTRTIPSSLLAGWTGLKNAFKLTWRTTSGELISTSSVDWCPNTGWRSRLSPQAPEMSRFTGGCGTHPFTKSMRWGIDRDWASQLFSYATISPPEGLTGTDAKLEVALRPELARIFGIPATESTHRFDMKVEDDTQTSQTDQPPPTTARSSARRTSARPTVPSGASDSRRAAPRTTTGFQPPSNTLPDLIALPAFGISAENADGRDILTFGATVYNGGRGPLVVDGYRRGGEALMDAYQSFYTAGGTKAAGVAKVGTMAYDAREGHQHWHFKAFALYDLVNTAGARVATSGKEAFCLAPTDAIDLLLPGAAVNPGNGDLETACGDETSLWVREVLANGYGDTYPQLKPGQALDITDLPNGTYWIRVTANPAGYLRELAKGNNVARRKVILGGTPGNRTVQVPAYNLINTES